MRDYTDCYTILGVSPDADWETLRAQYKRLIGQWHPDRFSADTAQHKSAEERSKQITVAYQALEQYLHDHGTLPAAKSALVADDAQGPARDSTLASDGDDPSYRYAAGTARADGEGRVRRARWRRVTLAGALLVGALYLGHDYLGETMPRDGRPADSVHEGDIPQTPPEPTEEAGGHLLISIGSTLGDVIAIQGIPTRTQGETWHYGKSEIRFAHGKVVSWTDDPDFPLRIARNQPVRLRKGTFQIGSTKDDVRATQGTPVTETAAVWDYGLSRVYFEDGRVVRWEDSPMQPLRVPR